MSEIYMEMKTFLGRESVCEGVFGALANSQASHGVFMGNMLVSQEREVEFPLMIENDTTMPFLCHHTCHTESSCSVILSFCPIRLKLLKSKDYLFLTLKCHPLHKSGK